MNYDKQYETLRHLYFSLQREYQWTDSDRWRVKNLLFDAVNVLLQIDSDLAKEFLIKVSSSDFRSKHQINEAVEDEK